MDCLIRVLCQEGFMIAQLECLENLAKDTIIEPIFYFYVHVHKL